MPRNAITDRELRWRRSGIADTLRDTIEIWTVTEERNTRGAAIPTTPVLVRSLPGLMGPPKVDRPIEGGRAAVERTVTVLLAYDADISATGPRFFRRAGTTTLFGWVSDNTGSSLRDGTVVIAKASDMRAELVASDPEPDPGP